MKEAVETIKDAFRQLSMRKAVVPDRLHIDVTEPAGTTLVMPGYLSEAGEMAVKIVSVFGENPARNLPAVTGVVVVIDPKTGLLLAILEGSFLTALRTGAASGAATDLLARKNATTAAIFGAGVQGRAQLEAICAVRPIERAWVFDIHPESARTFVEEMQRRVPASLVVAGDPAEAASGADVICTATTSATPVFDDRHIRPGTHINAVGVFKPHMQEVPSQTVGRAKIVVGSRSACLEEAGDLLVPIQQGVVSREDIHAEIGEIAAGLKPGRLSDTEVTLFKTVGSAVQDVAAASAVLSKAKALNLGTRIDLQESPPE
jgi:ornithine cyclodeaminase